MNPDLLLVTSTRRHGVVTLYVSGQLVYETCDEFTEHAEQALAARPGVKSVIVNCLQLTVVDSMGLSAFLALRRHVDAAGATLHLERRPRLLNRILEITGTLTYLTTGGGSPNASSATTSRETPRTHDGEQLPPTSDAGAGSDIGDHH
ncbi:STAS domain-containing protein [Streptomyces sp. NPDC001904]|uniref:STAS domain-containing protein n=1 Tax=Streptomyces sp. NPDC001904 TaxID=3154531 RepID=UPI003329C942